jgi:hypothetical protein
MERLGNTVTGVVRNINPTMICMCEVGETKNLLSDEQMRQVVTQIISAWTAAATEDIQLRSMFTTRGPIRDDLHTWSHPMLRLSDSGEPVLCRWRSSHCTNIWVLFASW